MFVIDKFYELAKLSSNLLNSEFSSLMELISKFSVK